MEEFRNDIGSDRSKNYSKWHWRHEEDKLLYQLVEQNGPRKWNYIAERMQGRSGKSCRLRWVNQLAPQLKRTPLNSYEELKLLNLHRIHENRWSIIALSFPGRTDNQLKNHFHVIMARNRRLVSDLSRTFAGFNKDQPHGLNLKTMYTSMNADLKQRRILELSNSPQTANILHAMQSYRLAKYYRYIMGKVAEFAKETKSFPPRIKGYNMEEKNVNQVFKMVKPMSLYDMFPATKPQPSMMIVQDQKDKLVQKKPPQFIDFLGVGNVE